MHSLNHRWSHLAALRGRPLRLRTYLLALLAVMALLQLGSGFVLFGAGREVAYESAREGSYAAAQAAADSVEINVLSTPEPELRCA